MWRTSAGSEGWRIYRVRDLRKPMHGENVVFALGSWPSRELAELMCDRLNAAEDKSSRYKKRPAERAFRQGRR